MTDKIETRPLNQTEQKIALKIARESIGAALGHQPYEPGVDDFPIFQTPRGVFVTLREDGALRGCIGMMESSEPLVEEIKNMAISAAFQDYRFSPLRHEELDKIHLEISVLSPLQKIKDPEQIELGKHGVLIRRGQQSGVYLPQVATEQGWDKETFLNSLCAEKAGLPENAWRDGSAELYTFTADVFEE